MTDGTYEDEIERCGSGSALSGLVMPKSKSVERRDDMSQSGKLRLFRQDDGDICMSIAKHDGDSDDGWVGIEFCIPGIGGGRSPKTHRALLALMAAIEEDNDTRPLEA